jgi:hypothetical protein
VGVACQADACEWVEAFHQVTAIRGHVVGRKLGPVQFGWLRQSFSVANATLTLYEYRSPARPADLKSIAVVKTDANGNFDFGKVNVGHYYLHMDAKNSGAMEDWFEVEVTDRVRPTRSILIDISPVHPDCTGGHDFIETKTINAT